VTSDQWPVTSHQSPVTSHQSPATSILDTPRVLHIVVYARKITFFLGNKNHIILFLYILVIVCANLTSNAVTFKRIADNYVSCNRFCNDYRTYLCWQVSSTLFSIIISSFDFNLFESFISRSKKKKSASPATMRSGYIWHNWTVSLSLCIPHQALQCQGKLGFFKIKKNFRHYATTWN